MKKIIAILALALPFLMTSCLKDEVYGGATISNITNTTAYTEADAVTVTAEVSAMVPLSSVSINYIAGKGSAQNVDMTGSGDKYTGVIPAQPLNTEVTFWIVAKTATMEMKSGEMKYTVGAVPIDYSGLILNELNGNDKFIELYNKGTDIPSIKGVKIQKDGKDVWEGDNRPLKKGDFLLLYSEDVVVAGGAKEGYDPALVFASGLSAKKAVRVQLFDPKSKSLSDFNLVTCVDPAKASYSRNANGKWYHADATPGAANKEGTEEVKGLEGGEPVVPGSVILNELNGNDKFIELANPGDTEFALGGYKLQKDGKDVWTADAKLVIPGHGFVLLYSEDVVVSGGAQEGYDETLVFASGLSAKKAVKVELFSDKAASVEAFNLVECKKTAPASYSKNKDGKWYFSEATPGAANKEGTEAVEGLE